LALLPETFLREFVLPLVVGGELHVHRPLDAEDLVSLEAEFVTVTEESLEVEQARQAIAAELWLYPVPTPLDRPSLELAAAVHNLLFLSHPGAKRWWVRSSPMRRLVSFTEACLRRPSPPRTGNELIARHTLLGKALEITRTDVEIRFWAGRRRFIGQEPPRRLFRWKELRGVRELRQQVTWAETELTQEQQQLLQLLLRQSPLTDLLSPGRAFPLFDWLPVAEYLADPRTCRLVCHRYLETGLDQVGPALAQAFWRLVDGGNNQQALQMVSGLVVYLYAATALTTEKKDHMRFDANHPMEALPVVLMVAARCGLVPEPSLLGDGRVQQRLVDWSGLPAASLGAVADELTHRLGQALAA